MVYSRLPSCPNSIGAREITIEITIENCQRGAARASFPSRSEIAIHLEMALRALDWVSDWEVAAPSEVSFFNVATEKSPVCQWRLVS